MVNLISSKFKKLENYCKKDFGKLIIDHKRQTFVRIISYKKVLFLKTF